MITVNKLREYKWQIEENMEFLFHGKDFWVLLGQNRDSQDKQEFQPPGAGWKEC